jgi:hypothetical protein
MSSQKEKELVRLDWKSYDDFEDYNGWTNRETWAVKVWYGDDETLHGIVKMELQPYLNELKEPDSDVNVVLFAVTNHLQYIYEEYIAFPILTLEYERPILQNARMMLSDMGSKWRIQWREIAEHYVGDFLEEQARENQ